MVSITMLTIIQIYTGFVNPCSGAYMVTAVITATAEPRTTLDQVSAYTLTYSTTDTARAKTLTMLI